MSGRKKIRYFSHGSNNHYISRGLLPRIREYLTVNGDSVVDVEKMALDLQAQHSEYSRKKRAAFQHLVSEVYHSHKRELGLAEKRQLCQSVGGGSSGGDEERWLVQREKEHLERNRGNVNQRSLEDADAAEKSSDSEDEEEFQTPNFNILNNSLIQIYKTDRTDVQNNDSTDNGVLTPSSTTTPDDHGDDGVIETENEKSTLAPGDSSLSHDQHVSGGEASVHSGSVESHPKPHPHSSNLLSATANALITNTEPIPTPSSVSMTPTQECADLAPVVVITEPQVSGKKVSFSTPEVTGQHDYVAGEEEESRTRRMKKRKTRRYEDEGSKAKRKKKEQEMVASSPPLRQSKSSQFVVQSSTVRFSDVGGCSDCLREVSKLLLHMRHPELFARLGVRPPQGFLLHGPPGCGKTLIANAIAGELGLPFIKLAATEIVSGVSGESEGTLRDLFQLAKDHAPCVLFIDEVDAICRKRETAQREMERRIVTQLLACLDDLNGSSYVGHVMVIGATSRPDSLDPALRRAGRFDREISIGIPDLQARLRVLTAHRQREKDQSELTAASGVVGGEGCSSGSEVSGLEGEVGSRHRFWEHLPLLTQQQLEATFISTADFLSALECVQPSAKREGFATVPNTTWEDVGALEGIRGELSMAILAPVRYPEQFASLGLSSPPGVLLAGPPGCGKTLLAKAIANESGINFISVKGPELLNMYVGESERAVRQVFQRAKNSSPCVIFFDELDALCPKRSEMAETSASARVVNQLLTEMDGLEARRQVFIMAATNRPDIIDPAVLRPGRLDKILYVGLPSPSDRAAILHTITKLSWEAHQAVMGGHGSLTAHQGGKRPKLGGDVDLDLLACDQHCKGFSGADLTALVREASIDALKEHMNLNPLDIATTLKPSQTHPSPSSPAATPQSAEEKECLVCMRHFTSALGKIQPSVSLKDQAFYQEMSERFSNKLTSLSASTDPTH